MPFMITVRFDVVGLTETEELLNFIVLFYCRIVGSLYWDSHYAVLHRNISITLKECQMYSFLSVWTRDNCACFGFNGARDVQTASLLHVVTNVLFFFRTC